MMVGASKILTVSYGTFACTLEGFEDPFSTMKRIAEYFRDLASDDRYFGAEPPVPDMEMLQQIAERSARRRVSAETSENGVILRQSADAADAEQIGASDTAAVPQDVPHNPAPVIAAAQALGEREADEGEGAATRDDPQEGSITEKLERIRRLAAEEPVEEPDPDVADQDFMDADEVTRDEAARAPASGPSAIITALGAAPEAPPPEHADEAGDAPAEADTDTAPSELPTDKDAAEALAGLPADDAAATTPDPDASIRDGTDSARDDSDITAAQTRATAQTGSTHTHAATATPVTITADHPLAPVGRASRRAARRALRAVRRGQAQLTHFTAPSGAAPGPNTDVDADSAAASPVPKPVRPERVRPAARGSARAKTRPETHPDTITTTLSADEEEDLARELESLRSSDDASDGRQALRPPSSVAPASSAAFSDNDTEDEEAALERLLETTNSKLRGSDSERTQNSFTHLKAAVAATWADRELAGKHPQETLSADSTEAYREDLAQVTEAGTRARGAKEVPLVLVSEQRIDETARPQTAANATAPDTPAAENQGPVRPRRVTTEILSLTDPEEERAVERTAIKHSDSFREFAERIGANTLPELLEAAAAYTSHVEGSARFSRAQVISKIERLKPRGDFSRDAGLRSFSQLLRDGRIRRVQDGQFVITDDSRFVQEARTGTR